MSLLTKASLVMTPNAIKSNKVYSIIPSNGNGDLTFTRDTSATQINSLGNVENVLTTIPRLNYDTVGGCPSLLLEPQRMNRLLNSAVVVTQTIATTGVACTVSFYGTGTIVFSGTYIGTLVGTGVNNRVSLTFTPTTGSLILTVTGSVTKGQLETGAYPTSYIPTTTTALTRNADVSSKSGISDLIGQTEGVMFIESAALFNELISRAICISDGTLSNRIVMRYNNSSNNLLVLGTVNGVAFTNTIGFTLTDETQFAKMAVRYRVNDISLWVNGVKRGTDITTQAIPLNLSKFGFDSGDGSFPLFAKVKQVQLYKTYLTDTEMTALTTL
jgi:hypothetical protein